MCSLALATTLRRTGSIGLGGCLHRVFATGLARLFLRHRLRPLQATVQAAQFARNGGIRLDQPEEIDRAVGQAEIRLGQRQIAHGGGDIDKGQNHQRRAPRQRQGVALHGVMRRGVQGEFVRFGKRDVPYRDLPIHGKRVTLWVVRRRYTCRACKTTFRPQLPEMVDGFRMTLRLHEYVEKESFNHPYTFVAAQTGLDEKTLRDIFNARAELLGRWHRAVERAKGWIDA